jgi:hypothetical protein
MGEQKSFDKMDTNKPASIEATVRRTTTNSRNPISGLSRLLLAVSIMILAFVLLLQPPTADLSTTLNDGNDAKTALILTAHPDDEVMFFTPTVLALLDAGWEVDALCLSNGMCCLIWRELMVGNGDGLGHVREEELFRSYEYLGVPFERVTVLDDLYVFSIVYVYADIDNQTSTRWYEQPLGFITRFSDTG